MTGAFEDATVEGYEPLIDVVTNHPKDRHVLAASVRCDAQAIVTFNVKDFGPDSVKPYGLDVFTPDEFLIHQLHLGVEAIAEKLAAQATARGIAFDELLRRLKKPALPPSSSYGARLMPDEPWAKAIRPLLV